MEKVQSKNSELRKRRNRAKLNEERKIHIHGGCPKCGHKFPYDVESFNLVLCCIIGVAKDPPECLWCGLSLDKQKKCFCNKFCSRSYHHELMPEIR